MNQDQQFLLKNLQNMIKYIQQETEKKVQIIKKDAIKDAELEKSKIIHPEKVNIKNKMLRELEEFKTSMKMYTAINNIKYSAQSQKMNKLRLEKLKIKIDCVNSVMEEVKTGLINRIKNKPDDYRQVLKDLIIQGLVKLLDENVHIFCKKSDFNVVSSLIEECKVAFYNLIAKESNKAKSINVKITIDEKYYLPDTVIGGVLITSMKNKIKLDNTLDKRLDLLEQTATPEIRKLLFKNSDVKVK